MSLSNIFEYNDFDIYSSSIKTSRIDTSQPAELDIGYTNANIIRLGSPSATVYVNDVLYTGGGVGLQGPAGPIGATGPRGPAGLNGTNGIDGINGTNGINGVNGSTGPTGTYSTDIDTATPGGSINIAMVNASYINLGGPATDVFINGVYTYPFDPYNTSLYGCVLLELPPSYLTGVGNNLFGYSIARDATTMNHCNIFGSDNCRYAISNYRNNIFGEVNLFNSPSGSNNCILGSNCIYNSSGNCSDNLLLGNDCASNYTTNESNNILLKNAGVNGDNNIIRIGSTQVKNFQAGIRGFAGDVGDGVPIYITSGNQLTTVGSASSGCIGGAGSTVLSANTWTKLTGLITTYNATNMTRTNDNELTYTGLVTQKLLVTASVSISSSVACNLYIAIGKNGIKYTTAGELGPIAVAIGQVVNFSPSLVDTFATNAYISLMLYSNVACTVTTTFCTLNAFSQ